VRRMVAEANIRKVGTIRGGGETPSRCQRMDSGLCLRSVHMYAHCSSSIGTLGPNWMGAGG
jgi:hypothetical protein